MHNVLKYINIFKTLAVRLRLIFQFTYVQYCNINCVNSICFSNMFYCIFQMHNVYSYINTYKQQTASRQLNVESTDIVQNQTFKKISIDALDMFLQQLKFNIIITRDMPEYHFDNEAIV